MMLERLTCCPGYNIRGDISPSELVEMIINFFDSSWDSLTPRQFTIQLFDGGERTNAICLFCPGQVYQCFAPSIDASVNFIDFDGEVTYNPSKERIIKMCEELKHCPN